MTGYGFSTARCPARAPSVVYCHGNPSHGEDWVPFMQRGGPSIAIDMPGWGRSERPDRDRFDYSMHGLSAFLERCLDELGVAQRKLVVHDWGSLALIDAQRRPDLVEKLVIVDVVPLLPGYRWHWVAQVWRRRPFGEIANATTKRSLALTRPSTLPREPATGPGSTTPRSSTGSSSSCVNSRITIIGCLVPSPR